MGNKNKTIEVQVIFKAIDIINGNAFHFITFEELSTKERVYLQVGIGNYMVIVEGDRGELHYKEQKKRYKSKFRSFERAISGIRQELTAIEEDNEDEVAILDEEYIATLEAEKNPTAHENGGEEVAVAALEVGEEPVIEETGENEAAALDEKVVTVSKKKGKK